MVNYSDIFPLSTGSGSGGSNQITVINSTTSINAGGFYLTDNIASNIEIDISGVPVNSELAFYNTSGKGVIVHGVSTVDGVSIPSTSGIGIARNSFAGFTKNTSSNVNKRGGNYVIHWKPANEPLYQYWRFAYNGNLSELRYDYMGEPFLLSSTNNCELSVISGAGTKTPSLQALSDGELGLTNTQYIGSGGASFSTIQATFSSPVCIGGVWFYPQSSANTIYNMPATITVSYSSNQSSWTQAAVLTVSSSGSYINPTTLSAQGMTLAQMKRLTW